MSSAFAKPMDPPSDWASLHFHPLSELVEFNTNIDFEGMVKDMTNKGYDPLKPIVLFWVAERNRFEILGGRHRHQGAIQAEVIPTFALFAGADPMDFIQRDLRRQHLDPSQRAVIAAKLANMKQGKPSKDTPQICGVSTAKAAEVLNVSPRSVESAKAVLAKGTEELKKAVESGNLKVSTAAQVVNEPSEVQDALAVLSQPVRCDACKKRGSKLQSECPACIEAQAKADKPKKGKSKKGKSKKGKSLTKAGKPLDWNWFDRQVGEMNRFFLELKVKDAARRDFVMKQLMQFSGVARDWKKEEAK